MRLLAAVSKKRFVAILVLAAIATSILGTRVSRPLRRWVRYALVGLADGPMYLTTAFSDRIDGVEELTPAEIERLRRENDVLRARLMTTGELYEQYRRRYLATQRLYRAMPDFPCELIPARVVGADSLAYSRRRTLNTGARAGASPEARVTTRMLVTDRAKVLPPGWATISATALVGRISDAGAFTAELQLVTDRGFRMPANIYRVIDPGDPRFVKVTRADAAARVRLSDAANVAIPVDARGDGAGGIVVEEVSSNHNILPGDWLITRRDDRFLPANVPVGQVSEVVADPRHPGFVNLLVRPHADLDALRDVYVVIPLTYPAGNGKGDE